MSTIRFLDTTSRYSAPSEERTMPLRARRCVVGLTYFSYATLFGVHWLDAVLPGSVPQWRGILAVCVWALGAGAHIGMVRLAPEAADPTERVRRAALGGLATLAVLYCLAQALLAAPGGPLPYHLGTLFWGGLLLILLVPTASLVWVPGQEQDHLVGFSDPG